MITNNPLRKAHHAIPLAALSLLLLTAGMCRQTEQTAPPELTERRDGEATEPDAAQIAAAETAAAEAAEAERERLAAERERELEERERQLREEEARLAEEQRLRRERERLAAERAAAAERERQLAERERQLREQEEEIARREEELAEAVVVDPAASDPLPAPTGSYEGDFDEPWRESQEGAEMEAENAGGADPQPAVEVTSVEAGERLEVQLDNTLSSATARIGDRFSSRLVEDLRDADGKVVIPAGAEVIGRVTDASPYRGGGGPATLGVEFTEIVISPEQRVGIRASFVELGADRKKNRRKVVAGAVVGAILGHILGGDGSKNVIVGAAAGAAAGGAVVASARDRDAELPAGQIIALQLEEVVTVEIAYGARAGG